MKKLDWKQKTINSFASKREIEALCRCFKNDNETFAKSKQNTKCDINKLKDYFRKDFNDRIEKDQPLELTEIPEFAKKLQKLPIEINSEPPNKNEIINTLKLLKNGNSSNYIPSAYLKYATDCEILIAELEKLYHIIWQTNMIPTDWSHSKLIAIWKGAAKGK